VGPVIAAAVIGDVRHVSRFPNRDHFAAYNGTAPIEVSSGGRKVCRLSRRGNRRLNHAIHTAAITQIRYRHSPGRACYDKKLAEGKTPQEALRALKRQISDAIFACLQADARRAAAQSPGRQPGHHSATRAAGSHPGHRLFGQATPGPATHTPTTSPLPFPRRRHLVRAVAGSRTGRSPAAQRRPQGVLDAAAREPTMPAAGKDRAHRGSA
jgi:transposase